MSKDKDLYAWQVHFRKTETGFDIGTMFVGKVDSDEVRVHLQMPKGSDHTDLITAAVEKRLDAGEDVPGKIIDYVLDKLKDRHSPENCKSLSRLSDVMMTRAMSCNVASDHGLYGLCPVCGGNGISRERRLNGDDTCENGHTYPSSQAIPAEEDQCT